MAERSQGVCRLGVPSGLEGEVSTRAHPVPPNGRRAAESPKGRRDAKAARGAISLRRVSLRGASTPMGPPP